MGPLRILFVIGSSAFAVSALGQSVQGGATPHAVFATEPTVDRLENGLTVVTVPWDSPGIIAYFTLVRVGSRDEVEPGHSGFAHLFEHMMFRGTARYPEDQYERAMRSFGADHNAYTSNDFTLYTITAPSSVLETLVDIESESIRGQRGSSRSP